MKLISMCVLLLAVYAWSNIFSIDAGVSFEKGYLEIDTTKTCNVDTSYINCSLENGLAYYSTLDTAVAVFFMPRIAQASVYALQSNPNTRSLTEILRYEFIKWVEWGIIVMTKDSAQRLLDRILPDSLQMNNRHILHKKVCDTDPSQCPNWGPYGGGLSSGLSDEDANRLPKKKVLLNEESVNPGTTSLPRESGKAIQGMWTVPPGTGYKAFDMNGIYLNRGSWNGSFTTLGKPIVLKFENGKTVVFR